MNKKISIYIHIPFCKSKCFYCDFCSFDNKENYIDKYVDSLIYEILSASEMLSTYDIETIYIGGGTPSYIDSKYIVKIMSILNMFVSKSSLKEVTIEINPNSLTKQKISDYLNCGINRFSVGLQSTYDKVLKSIGRIHTYSDYIKCLDILKNAGATNISTDIIYPLPNLDLEDFKKSIDLILENSKNYPINHISIYNLELHENTKLAFLVSEGYLKMCSEDDEYLMKEYLEDALKEGGYNKYEISNYAKEGFESIHNLNYWKQNEYLGFGIGAASFVSGVRYSNISDLDKYIDYYLNNNKENIVVALKESEMNKLELMKEYVILGLRITKGINLDSFKTRFKLELKEIFKKEIYNLLNKELLAESDGYIFLTKRGQELANIVWEEFI